MFQQKGLSNDDISAQKQFYLHKPRRLPSVRSYSLAVATAFNGFHRFSHKIKQNFSVRSGVPFTISIQLNLYDWSDVA